MSIPRTEAELVAFASNFNVQLNAVPATYFVTAPQASVFDDLSIAYTNAQTALDQSRANGVQSKLLTAARNTARDAMLPTLRGYYAQIQNNPAITDEAKLAIGVQPKKARTRKPAIIVRPALEIVSVVDRTITINVHDAASKKSKPPTAVQAWVYWFSGETSPSDPSLWQFAGAANKSNFSFTLPESVAGGAKLFVSAAWVNRRGEAGPPCAPAVTYVQGGTVLPTPAAMKLAA